MVLCYFTFHSFYYFSIVPYIFIHRPSDIHLFLKSNYPGIHPYINYHQQKIEYLDHFFIHLNSFPNNARRQAMSKYHYRFGDRFTIHHHIKPHRCVYTYLTHWPYHYSTIPNIHPHQYAKVSLIRGLCPFPNHRHSNYRLAKCVFRYHLSYHPSNDHHRYLHFPFLFVEVKI